MIPGASRDAGDHFKTLRVLLRSKPDIRKAGPENAGIRMGARDVHTSFVQRVLELARKVHRRILPKPFEDGFHLASGSSVTDGSVASLSGRISQAV